MKRLILKPLVLRRLAKKQRAPATESDIPSLVEHLLQTFADRLPPPPKPAR